MATTEIPIYKWVFELPGFPFHLGAFLVTFRASDPEKVFDYTKQYPSDYTISKVRDDVSRVGHGVSLDPPR